MTDARIPMGEGREQRAREVLEAVVRGEHDALEIGRDPARNPLEMVDADDAIRAMLAFADTPPPAADGERALAIARALHNRFCERAKARVTHDPLDASCYSNNAWEQLPPSMQREYRDDAAFILKALRTPEPNRGGEGTPDATKKEPKP